MQDCEADLSQLVKLRSEIQIFRQDFRPYTAILSAQYY